MDVHAFAAEALDWLRAQPAWLAAATIGVTAGLEYVAPPVPGDTVAIAGGILVAQGILPTAVVIVAVTVGSVLGALGAYGMGVVASRRLWLRRLIFRMVSEDRLEQAAATYRRWGRAVILANRFLPGVRTSFLIAAGFFGVSLVDVLVLSAVSAVLWNALLVAAGVWLGANLDAVITLVEHYSTMAWGVVGFVVLLLLMRAARAARRRR